MISSTPSEPTRKAAGRSGGLLAALATVVALWVGLTAPTVSPVAPPAGGAAAPVAAVQVTSVQVAAVRIADVTVQP